MGYISNMSSEARARSLPAVVVKTGPTGEMRVLAHPGPGPVGRAVMTAALGATPPEGWMKKCVLSKGILLKGSICVLCLSYPAEVRVPCMQCLGGGYTV